MLWGKNRGWVVGGSDLRSGSQTSLSEEGTWLLEHDRPGGDTGKRWEMSRGGKAAGWEGSGDRAIDRLHGHSLAPPCVLHVGPEQWTDKVSASAEHLLEQGWGLRVLFYVGCSERVSGKMAFWPRPGGRRVVKWGGWRATVQRDRGRSCGRSWGSGGHGEDLGCDWQEMAGIWAKEWHELWPAAAELRMGTGRSREPIGGGGCCGPGQRSHVPDQGGGGEDWEREWESGSTNRLADAYGMVVEDEETGGGAWSPVSKGWAWGIDRSHGHGTAGKNSDFVLCVAKSVEVLDKVRWHKDNISNRDIYWGLIMEWFLQLPRKGLFCCYHTHFINEETEACRG